MPSVLARIETILARLSDPRDDDTEAQQATAVFGARLKTILLGFARAAEALRSHPEDYSQHIPDGLIGEQIGRWFMDPGMVFCSSALLGRELLALSNDLEAKVDLNRTIMAIRTALKGNPFDRVLQKVQPLLVILERDFDGCLYSSTDWIETVGRPLLRILEGPAIHKYEGDLKRRFYFLTVMVGGAVDAYLKNKRKMSSPRRPPIRTPAAGKSIGTAAPTIPDRIDEVMRVLSNRRNADARRAEAFFGASFERVKQKLASVRDAMLSNPENGLDDVPSDLLYEELMHAILTNGSGFVVNVPLGAEITEIQSEIEKRVKVRRALRIVRASLRTTPKDEVLCRLKELLSGVVRDFDGSLHPAAGWYEQYGLPLLAVLREANTAARSEHGELAGYLDQLLTTVQDAVQEHELNEWLARGT